MLTFLLPLVKYPLIAVIVLLTIHFVADFLLQSRWMGNNKSKMWDALFAHTFVYSICFIGFGWKFVLITFIFHTVIDAISSRATSALYENGEIGWFFSVIGFDQYLHVCILIGTWYWLFLRHVS